MIDPENYPKILPNAPDIYTTEGDIINIQGCFSSSKKNELDNNIDTYGDNPDIKNKKRQEIIEFLSYFDTNGSGLVNVSEIRNVLNILNEYNEGNFSDLLSRAEIEGNGYISYRDFAYSIIK